MFYNYKGSHRVNLYLYEGDKKKEERKEKMKLFKKLGLLVASTVACASFAGIVSADDVKTPNKVETPYYSSTYDGGEVSINWETDSSADGYEIEYSYVSGKKTRVKDIGTSRTY